MVVRLKGPRNGGQVAERMMDRDRADLSLPVLHHRQRLEPHIREQNAVRREFMLQEAIERHVSSHLPCHCQDHDGIRERSGGGTPASSGGGTADLVWKRVK